MLDTICNHLNSLKGQLFTPSIESVAITNDLTNQQETSKKGLYWVRITRHTFEYTYYKLNEKIVISLNYQTKQRSKNNQPFPPKASTKNLEKFIQKMQDDIKRKKAVILEEPRS